MSSEKNIALPMKELSRKIAELTAKLADGSISATELDQLQNDCRNLYEKITIVRYKHIESKVKNTETPVEKDVQLVKEPETKPDVKEEIEEPTEQAAFNFTNMFSSPKQTEEPKQEVKETPVLEPEPEVEPPKAEEKQPEVVEEIQEVSEPKPLDEIIDNKKESKEDINESFEAAPSVLDSYVTEEDGSLAKKLEQTPIDDIKTHIGINEKFLLISDLFDNESEQYDVSIAKLNGFNGADEARNYLSVLAAKYDWNLESKKVMRFVELVERRYL